jgi:hypothetical protein
MGRAKRSKVYYTFRVWIHPCHMAIVWNEKSAQVLWSSVLSSENLSKKVEATYIECLSWKSSQEPIVFLVINVYKPKLLSPKVTSIKSFIPAHSACFASVLFTSASLITKRVYLTSPAPIKVLTTLSHSQDLPHDESWCRASNPQQLLLFLRLF